MTGQNWYFPRSVEVESLAAAFFTESHGANLPPQLKRATISASIECSHPEGRSRLAGMRRQRSDSVLPSFVLCFKGGCHGPETNDGAAGLEHVLFIFTLPICLSIRSADSAADP